MDNRETYQEKYAAEIRQTAEKLETRLRELGDQARVEMKPHLDAVNVRMAQATAALRRATQATEERWDELKQNADQAWQDVKLAVQHAHDAITRQQARSRIPHVAGDAPFADPLPAVGGTFDPPAAPARSRRMRESRPQRESRAHHHHH